MMHNIAGLHRIRSARRQVQDDIARRMAGRRFQRDAVIKLVVGVDQNGLPGFDDRQDAVVVDRPSLPCFMRYAQ